MTQIGRMSNPYLYETLKLMIGQMIVVQTKKNIQQG
ncbi:Tyrosyl-tRNA deacylase OS=Lysinibacillus sphaericus OX=1421 GN=LS41612_07445 PE=4 SV=1 [Lysinibacillus sphaericus]